MAGEQPVRRCRRRCGPAPPVLAGHPGRNRRRPPRRLAPQAGDRPGTVVRPGHLAVRRSAGRPARPAVRRHRRARPARCPRRRRARRGARRPARPHGHRRGRRLARPRPRLGPPARSVAPCGRPHRQHRARRGRARGAQPAADLRRCRRSVGLGRPAVRRDGRRRPRHRRRAQPRPPAPPAARPARGRPIRHARHGRRRTGSHWARAISIPRASPPGGRRTRRHRRSRGATGSRAGEGTREKTCRRCSPWRAPPRTGWRPASPIAPIRCTHCSPPSAGAAARDRPAASSCRSGPPIRRSGFPGATRCPACAATPPTASPAAAARSPGRSPSSTSWPKARGWRCANSTGWKRPPSRAGGSWPASDKRSRLPDALDALLRVPALTPKALAARLKVAPQTGTALLRELQGRGVVREVTGRGSFRAFAI